MNSQTTIIIRGQWRSRQETSAAAGARLSAMLSAIGMVSPHLTEWYRKTSRRPSREPVVPSTSTPESAERFILSGARPNEPEAGFSVSAWNGEIQQASANFSLTIGAHDGKHAAFNRVQVVLSDATGLRSLSSFTVVRDVAKAVVSTMEPSSLDVTTRRWMLSGPPGSEFTCPAGGWMSYVEGSQSFELPAGIETEPLVSGLLLIATKADFSDSDPSHVDAGYRLNEVLGDIRKIENDLTPGSVRALG
jgi:hypothetical protein